MSIICYQCKKKDSIEELTAFCSVECKREYNKEKNSAPEISSERKKVHFAFQNGNGIEISKTLKEYVAWRFHKVPMKGVKLSTKPKKVVKSIVNSMSTEERLMSTPLSSKNQSNVVENGEDYLGVFAT